MKDNTIRKKFTENFKKSEKEEVFNDGIEEMKNEAIENGLVESIEEIAAESNDEVKPSTVAGVVTGCEKLNVREKALIDSKVLCVINKGEEVQVDLTVKGQPVPSDVSFYKVCTVSGIEGYCMTKYIAVK